MNFEGIEMYNVSAVETNLETIDSEISSARKRCADLEDLNQRMKKVWTSDTIDKTSYFDYSANNLKNIENVFKAMELTLEYLRDYIVKLRNETNN